MAQGRAGGKADGTAQAILAVLSTRGLEVPASVRERILGSTELATLEEWLRRAVSVGDVAELLR